MEVNVTAKEVGSFLENRVRASGVDAVIFYNELASYFDLPEIGEHWKQHPLCKIFEDIDNEDAKYNRPFRTVLVISRDKGRPGKGFYTTVSNLRKPSPRCITDLEKQELFNKELQSLVKHYCTNKATKAAPK